MTELQLLSEKEIKIIYCIVGCEIKLKTKINIFKETIFNLYYKIKIETNKVNISSIMINNFVINIHENINHCINNEYIDKTFNLFYNTKILNLLNENYDKDYIKVLIIFGSYIPYIKNIIDTYSTYIYCYGYTCGNNELNEFNIAERKYNENFIYDSLSKLNDNCISFEEYDEITSYVLYKIKQNLPERDYYVTFILNEIKKYLPIDY